ncbi:hypothetical protein ACJMK2_014109 [Sinanodonta woodiana]|uniref:Band 7 domain-containing protein n=1 Tax=Sinanodonta woodiana TaxID=1069815 RepID=A0ABD3UZL1_SINWO
MACCENEGSKCKCVAVLFIVGVLVIFVAVMIGVSLKKLNSDEVGIAYDTVNKVLGTDTKREGLHNGPPGFEFIIFPSVFKSLEFTDLECLNKDGVVIHLHVIYQFKARPNNLRDIILSYKDYDGYKKVLTYTGESALHEVCSEFNTSQFQSERGIFQERVRQRIIDKYESLQCEITDLQVSNIARPSEYESAIRSKERAREDIQVALSERPRLLTEAETAKREAETQAQIIIDKAYSDARILENRAKTEAEAIIVQYAKEAEAYRNILSASGLGFTVEGFISYLGTRVIASAKNPVYIGLSSPAKSSYATP